MPGGQSRWSQGKDLSWEPLRPNSSSKSPTNTCRAALPSHGPVPPLAHRQEPAGLHLRPAGSRPAARTNGDLRHAAAELYPHRSLSSSPQLRTPLPRRIVIRIRRLLRRPLLLRHMPQVHPNPRPRRRPPRIESTSTSSTARSAAASGYFSFHRSKPRQRSLLVGEFATTISGIFDCRASSLLSPLLGRLFAREGATRGASPSILRKCGGHGASPNPAASSSAASSSNASSDPAAASISACGSPIFANRSGTVNTVKSAGSQSATSSQSQRRRNPRIRQRPHRVSRASRPILRILVVVQKHAVPLLLPPLRSLPAQAPAAPPRATSASAARRTSREAPSRLDPHIHMHPARPAGLRPATQAQLLQQRTSPPAQRAAHRPNPPPAPDRDRPAAHPDDPDHAARTGCGCSSMHPRLTIHASPAASSTTISSAVRPEGNDSVTVRSHEGRSPGARF